MNKFKAKRKETKQMRESRFIKMNDKPSKLRISKRIKICLVKNVEVNLEI